MAGIIAIDPGTCTGFAFCEPGQTPVWEHKLLGGKNTSPGQIGASFGIFLQSRIETYKPEWIVYEQPYVPQGQTQVPLNFQTLFVLLGLAFEIDTIAHRYGVECRSITSLTFTNYFTGQAKFPGKNYAERRQNKKAAVMQVCKLHGWDASSDEADALALLAYAESILYPQGAMQRPAGPLFYETAGG